MNAAADDEPICRICYAGLEEGLQLGLGRLVSPCLCVGSMRFVHTVCLEQWRTASANPRSFYQCDNCLYRYSFRRTLAAQLIRSVLVLHLITTMLLIVLLLLGAGLIALIDSTFLENSMVQIHWLHALVESASAERDDAAGMLGGGLGGTLLDGLLSSGWGAYIFWSFVSLGLLGFLTLGMMGPVFFGGGRRGHGHEGMLLLFVVVGIIRTFSLIYDFVKVRSGHLLQHAERLIVEVGAAAPEPAPRVSRAASHAVANTDDAADSATGTTPLTSAANETPSIITSASSSGATLEAGKAIVTEVPAAEDAASLARRQPHSLDEAAE